MFEETSKECLQYSDWPTRLNTMKDDSDDKLYLLPNLYKHQSTDITTVYAGGSDSCWKEWRFSFFLYIFL